LYDNFFFSEKNKNKKQATVYYLAVLGCEENKTEKNQLTRPELLFHSGFYTTGSLRSGSLLFTKTLTFFLSKFGRFPA